MATDQTGQAEAYSGGEQFDVGLAGIRAMHAECAARGNRYAPLNMPEHPDKYPDPPGAEIKLAYLPTLRTLAQQEDFAFIDPAGGDTSEFAIDGAVYDYHHMTTDGAAALTRAIGPVLRPEIAQVLSD